MANFAYYTDRTPIIELPITRTKRLLATQSKFLRALATALVAKKHTTDASSFAAAAAALTTSPHAIAVTHKSFLRSIMTASAAGRTPAHVPALTTQELIRLLGGTEYSRTKQKTDVWSALERVLRAALAVTKECLTNPWVDVGLVLVAVVTLSWIYGRKPSSLPESDAESDVESDSESDADSEKSSPIPKDQTHLLHTLETLTTAHNHTQTLLDSLTTSHTALLSRAANLATALETSLAHARQLSDRLVESQTRIERLEEENRTLVARLQGEEEWEVLGG
ncbi:uncharacterized protein SPPG_06351 [Spizellomyces punctatus DAOM BR117]|uniref:Uncharacterized protein n=1 Tax=Spizellomyces punctatus (strain DAOM BR117) TaxID=645134 RepID=A0A0L0HCP7_SPIPD|nr:uncharacterized protein SPPG_06351 [Spizellomyces punctatus DAOM BR117]KNC98669.1 hypothetical protein SPPG_06351 [Spizellomyces punctatus DAOM BR117]|eukprot:XP_016606709.1 hypothetical protein SPPG_06351 [Spizellomyces punctatus DAOM BR117]